MGKGDDYEQEVAEAKYPSIRLLQVKKTTSVTPAENVEMNMGGWQECNSSTVPELLGHSYFYARRTMERIECAHWCD